MVRRAVSWTAMALVLTSGTISIANSAAPYCATALSRLSSRSYRFQLIALVIAAIVISCALPRQDRHDETYHPVPLVRHLSRRLSREIWSHFPVFHPDAQDTWRDSAPPDSGTDFRTLSRRLSQEFRSHLPAFNPEPQETRRDNIPADSGTDFRTLSRRLSREFWSHLPAFNPEPQDCTWRDIPVVDDIPPPSGPADPWLSASAPPLPEAAEKSMEATWKAISDAKKVMKRSWTWERRNRPEMERRAAMRKAREETTVRGRRRQQEMVMEKDELSRQVESFIKNHYLQRQESEKKRRLANKSNLNGQDFLYRNYYQPPISV